MEHKYLVEVFLPLFDGQGRKLPAPLYEDVRRKLVDRFGGMTAHRLRLVFGKRTARHR